MSPDRKVLGLILAFLLVLWLLSECVDKKCV